MSPQVLGRCVYLYHNTVQYPNLSFSISTGILKSKETPG